MDALEELTNQFLAAGLAPLIYEKHGELFRWADPTTTPDRPGAPEHPTTRCIEWMHATTTDGYGQVGSEGKMRKVHIVACELSGLIAPPNFHHAHRCENRLCCQSDHIRFLSNQENAREGAMRVYSDEVLSRAPKWACKECGDSTDVSVKVNIRPKKTDYYWQYSCKAHCSAYRKALKAGVIPLPWNGQKYIPMTPAERSQFLEGEL